MVGCEYLRKCRYSRLAGLAISLAALGAPAYAATVVSNLSETANSDNMRIGVHDTGFSYVEILCATSFTTGSHSSGHRLNSVTAKFDAKVGSALPVDVDIYSNSTTGGGQPNAKTADLTGSDPDSAGNHTYSCSGATCLLSPGTAYWLVFAAPDEAGQSLNLYYQWKNTASDSQTSTPSDNGWSIGNDEKCKLDTSSSWTDYSNIAGGSIGSRLFSVDASELTPTLTASAVTATGATLTIGDYIGSNWYYKYTSPTQGTCSSAQTGSSASVTTLTAGTSYTFKAYSDSSCSTLVATAADFITIPATPTGLSVQSSHQTLAASWNSTTGATSYVLGWRVSGTTDFTTTEVTGTSATISSLTNGTGYDVVVKAKNASGESAETVVVNGTPAPTLTASALKQTGATLTIDGHTAAWWYKGNQSGAQCTAVAANTATVTVTGLTGNTSYSYSAYSASGCDATNLVAVSSSFTTFDLTAGTIAQTTATLTLSGSTAAWWYKGDQSGAQCTAVAADTASASLNNLTHNTSYTYKVYSDSGCSGEIASTDFTTLSAYSLSAPTVSQGYVILRLAAVAGFSIPDPWYYKYTSPSGGTCQTVSGGASSVTDRSVSGGMSYSFKAYSDSSCQTEIASTNFTTPDLEASAIGQKTATLTVSGYTDQWWHKQLSPPGGNCANVDAGTATVNLTNLNPGQGYNWQAFRDGGCSQSFALTSFTTQLLFEASNVTQNTATLTIAATVTGGWYYKQTVPSGSTNCVFVGANTTTANLTNLTANTNYEFAAYTEPTCSTVLTGPTSFSTLANAAPSTPAAPTVVWGNGSATLTWTAPANNGVAISDYDYQTRNQTDSGSWTDYDSSDTSTSTTKSITGLTNGKLFRFRVRAGNSVGDGEWSNYGEAVIGSPAPVTAPVLVPNANGQVKVFWTAPATNGSAITGYSIWHKQGTGSWTEVSGLSGTASSSTVTLTANQDYMIGVEAFNANGGSNVSASSFAGTTANIRTASPSLQIGNITDSFAQFTLSGFTDGVSMPLAWSHKSSLSNAACVDIPAGNRQSSVSDLQTATSYTWSAYAGANCVTGRELVTSSFSTTGLSVASVTETGADLTIANWTAAWWYKGNQGGATCTEVNANTATTSIADTLVGSSKYIYKAFKAAGCFDGNRIATSAEFTTLSLTASSVTNMSATLNLANHTGNWYHKYTSPTGGNCSSAISGLTVDLTDLLGSQTYDFEVYDQAGCDASDKIADVSFTTLAPVVATAPTVPAATAGNARVSLAWNAPVNNGGALITGYRIAYATSSNGPWTNWTHSGTGRTAVVTGLTNGTGYVFRIRAINSVGNSNWSVISRQVTPSSDNTMTGICGRTEAVRDAIIAKVEGKSTCSAIVSEDLAGITSLTINNKSFTSLKTIDFAGLISLRTLDLDFNKMLVTLPAGVFGELGALRTLELEWNKIASLPAGLFDSLDSLITLKLKRTELTRLPAGIFDELTSLDSLNLERGKIASLPAGIFDELTGMSSLLVGDNLLTSLSASTFSELTGLSELGLDYNNLTSLPNNIFGALTNLKQLYLTGNGLTCLPEIPGSVTYLDVENSARSYVCGARITASTANLAVGVNATNTYSIALQFVPNGNVTVAPASSSSTAATVSPSSLTFTVANWSTAQTISVSGGSSAGSATVSHTATGGGYGLAAADDVSITVSDKPLTVSAIKQTTATLTLANHNTAWWLKGEWSKGESEEGSTGCISVGAGTSPVTYDLTELTGGTTYTYSAYSAQGCNDNQRFSTANAFTTIGLTADPRQTTATLTLSSWDAAWWHKETPQVGSGSCTAIAANTSAATLSGLTVSTDYSSTVYSASGCNDTDKIADVDYRTLAAATLAVSEVKETTARLVISNYPDAWWYKSNQNGDCVAVSAATASVNLSGLTGGTRYVFQAFSASGCSQSDLVVAAPAFSTVGLTADPRQTTAQLTLENWEQAWWHKETSPSQSGACTAVVAGTTEVDLSSLSGSTNYSWAAYSASGCGSTVKIADTDFSTLDAISLGVGGIRDTRATLTIRNHPDAWWYKGSQADAGCVPVQAGTAAVNLLNLDAGATYTFMAYNQSGCAADNRVATSQEFTTKRLTPSNIQDSSADLTLEAHTGPWYFKYIEPSGGACSSAVTSGTASVTELTSGTTYSFRAYDDSGCSIDLATASDFTTLAAPGVGLSPTSLVVSTQRKSIYTVILQALPSASVTVVPMSDETTKATVSTAAVNDNNLTFTTGNWNTAQAFTVSGIAEGSATMSHTVSGGNYEDVSAGTVEVSVVTWSLTAENIKETTATLKLADGNQTPESWYFKYVQPAGGTCSSTVTGTSTELTGLTGATRYTYKAYSVAGCDEAFIAAEAAPFSTVGLTAGSVTTTTAVLSLVNWNEAWWHQAISPSETQECVSIASDTSTASLSELTENTKYNWAVYSESGCSGATKIADVEFTTLRSGPSAQERLTGINQVLAPEAARAVSTATAEVIVDRIERRFRGDDAIPSTLVHALTRQLERNSSALERGTFKTRDLLADSYMSHSFAEAKESGSGSTGSLSTGLWAAGQFRSLSGGEGLTWKGSLTAMHFGIDTPVRPGWLAGLAVSSAEIEFDYHDKRPSHEDKGKWSLRLSGLTPYTSRLWADGSKLWALVGYHSGKLVLNSEQITDQQMSDSSLASLAAGGSMRLFPSQSDALRVDIKGEAMTAQLKIKGNGDLLKAVDSTIHRLRLAVAGEMVMAAGPEATVTPSAELALRYDGGDGVTGFGVELGVGLSYALSRQGMFFDTKARALLTHRHDISDWGVTGSFMYAPGSAGLGPSLGLNVGVGNTQSASSRLLEDGAAASSESDITRPVRQLEANAGYGVRVPKMPGAILTPKLGLNVADNGSRRYAFGIQLKNKSMASLSVETSRTESRTGQPVNRAALRLDYEW